MTIPKYIDEALRLRTKYAILLDDKCRIIDEWLDKNDIETDYDDSHGGVEIYVNPRSTERHLREFLMSLKDTEDNH